MHCLKALFFIHIFYTFLPLMHFSYVNRESIYVMIVLRNIYIYGNYIKCVCIMHFVTIFVISLIIHELISR